MLYVDIVAGGGENEDDEREMIEAIIGGVVGFVVIIALIALIIGVVVKLKIGRTNDREWLSFLYM